MGNREKKVTNIHYSLVTSCRNEDSNSYIYFPCLFTHYPLVFPVVMYGCESWTMKKAEHQRIDGFELWYWRRLESPLDFKEIQPVQPKGNQP